MSTADAHHLPETTDATPPVTIVDTARAPAIGKILSKKGAGLEIPVTMTETGGTETVAGEGTAEDMFMTGEVSYKPRQFLHEE